MGKIGSNQVTSQKADVEKDVNNYRYQFSVIIPTYNRPRQLRSCLSSISRLKYPVEGFEVVVVDDGSHRPLNRVVQSFHHRLNLRMIRVPNCGPGAARNRGAAIAHGQFLAFTDDDCWPTPDWLRELEAHFKKTPDSMIGGRTVNRIKGNPYSTTSQLIVETAYAFCNKNPKSARFFASNNMAVNARLFQKVGGFDRAFRVASEDRELCDRWLNLGYKLTYAPEAVVLHGHPLTFSSFCKQHFNYGRGAFQYWFVRAKRHSGSVRESMRFHIQLIGLLRHPVSALPLGSALNVLTLIVVWECVNAGGFLYEKFHTNKFLLEAPWNTRETESQEFL